MPTSSNAGSYAVPEPTDPPDVPYWLKSLADEVEETALQHTGNVRRRIHLQAYPAGTTDANGFYNVYHSCGFTPRGALQILTAPASSWGIAWGVDSFTTVSARTRWHAANANGPLVSASTGAFMILYFE